MAEKDKKDSKRDKPMTREEALENALKQIEKAHGKGAIMRLGEAKANMNIEVISTGILPLDIALGVGGIPRGRIIEVYGPESSGKTTVTLHMIAEAQKTGGLAAFIDAEHALDPEYARKLGVNTEDLLISQPDTGEQALEIVDALVHSGAIDIIVVDSVAALVPKSEIDGDMGSSVVGLQARLMSQAMRKLTGIISKTRTVADVRHAFTKNGGNLGTDGCVAFNFVHQGYLVFEPGVDEDALMEAALEAGAEDVIANDDGSIEVITAPNDWAGVKAALETAGYKSVDGDVTMRAQNETELSGEDAVKMQKLIDALEDLDDVQDVYTSAVLELE